MAKSSSLEDDHHLVRHIRATEIDDQEGKLLAFPQAFALRSKEPYLSNAWLEFFSGAVVTQLNGVVATMTLSVKAHHALAIGRVGDIRDACSSFDQRVRILHEPALSANPAYATIRRINTDELQLLELLAQEAWSDVRMAKPYVEAVGPWQPA